MIYLQKFENFSNENNIDLIFNQIYEAEANWINNNTVEWDLTNNDNTFEWDLTNHKRGDFSKLKDILSKIPKDKIREYFIKLVNKTKSLPIFLRKRLLLTYSTIFLSFVSLNYLLDDTKVLNIPVSSASFKIDNELKKEIIMLTKKAKFDDAQEIVKSAEAGYSNDRGDTGNWYKGRFIGTNHGISAPVLANYLGRIPSKDDMVNLPYETALEIYKNSFWDDQNLSEINNQSIANIVYDGCVNQGKTAISNIFKNSLIEMGIKIGNNDDPFDIKWIKKANELNHHKLFNSIKKGRENRYRESRTFRRHGNGWLKRLNNIKFFN